MRHAIRVLSWTMVLLLVAGAGSQSQPASASAPPEPKAEASAEPQIPRPRRSQEEDRFEIERRHQMERQRNKERQVALKKDTDKLLELATQLKDYVDKTDENILSLDVIKKAEEIEKLSKKVRENMKADAYYPPAGADLNRPQ